MMRLFIDFDSVITDTNKAFIEYYNEHYKGLEGFIEADDADCNEWNFTDTCPLAIDDVSEIFGTKELFDRLEFFPGVYEALKEISTRREVIIVSIGTFNNIHWKSKWVKENLPFIHESIFLCKDRDVIMDKSTVNMEGGIFIDDVKSNLDSTNAERKILFGRKFPWNEEWSGEYYANWQRLGNAL